MKKATLYDIAKALNVTVSTVSRALNGFPAISDATRKAVLQTAKQLNYSPNRIAAALKSGKTHTIGIIVPSVKAHFFATIINSIEEGLKDAGYRIIVCQSKESLVKEIESVKALKEAQVDGIMASMSLETNDCTHFKELIAQNVPLVLFDRINKPLKVPTISLNDFKAGFIATEHLLLKGYRNILFITTQQQVKIFKNRLEGYKAALSANGLPVVYNNIRFSNLSIEDGIKIGAEIFRSKNRPDAIIAADDFTALGIMQALKTSGLTPPEIGVIGFANETFSEYVTPSLTTIEQHPASMGKACAEMFLDMVHAANPYDNIKHFVIEPVIIERGSTAGTRP